MNKYIGTRINVLDHGHVTLVDFMGSDDDIVAGARISYGAGTKTVQDDKGLIRYLVRHKHTSPLEMVVFKFHCKMPIFVARQWVRHRTASLNEISARYSEMKDEFYKPEPEQVRLQSNNNKQGGVIPAEDDLAKEFRFDCDTIDSMCYQTYEEHLGEGIARETARINLPISLYTEWYWQINLHNLFHFLKLRMDPHAQYEIRVYADALYELVKPIVPIASEAFEDYIWKAHTFSQHEMSVLKELLHDHITTEKIVGILDRESDKLSKRERAEFRNKIGF